MDELTGLSNRRGLEALAGHLLAVSRRSGTPATLLFIDLDHFKQINDDYGHAEGDRALVDFARLLSTSFRDSDVVARLGGDEFCVLLTGASTDSVCRPVAVLDEAVARWNAENPQRLAYSLGAVAYDPGEHRSLGDLLDQADRLMYERKRES